MQADVNYLSGAQCDIAVGDVFTDLVREGISLTGDERADHMEALHAILEAPEYCAYREPELLWRAAQQLGLLLSIDECLEGVYAPINSHGSDRAHVAFDASDGPPTAADTLVVHQALVKVITIERQRRKKSGAQDARAIVKKARAQGYDITTDRRGHQVLSKPGENLRTWIADHKKAKGPGVLNGIAKKLGLDL